MLMPNRCRYETAAQMRLKLGILNWKLLWLRLKAETYGAVAWKMLRCRKAEGRNACRSLLSKLGDDALSQSWKVGELMLLPTGLIQQLLPLDCRMHAVAEI